DSDSLLCRRSGGRSLVRHGDAGDATNVLVGQQAAGAQQRSEAAVAGGELVEAASLDHPSLVEEDDAIGIAHCGEAVRDDEGGAAATQLVDRLLDTRLRL